VTKLPPEIVKVLDSTGLPWTAELGSRHLKLRLQGRLVGVLPKDGGRRTADTAPRAARNIAAQIRRAAREIRGLDNHTGGVIVVDDKTGKE